MKIPRAPALDDTTSFQYQAADLPVILRQRTVGCRILVLLLLCGTVGLAPAEQPGERQFRAGAATSNITPFVGAPIVGGWSAPASTHINDELHARCLVLDDGRVRLAFVVVDNVGIPREIWDEAKRLAHEATGIPTAHMMMSATHTHSAPSARGASSMASGGPPDEYQRFVIRRIADGVRRAYINLEPARVAWGAGSVPQHTFSRRWILKDGETEMNPFGGHDRVGRTDRSKLLKPAGPANPEVYFLSVEAADGRPIALLANYWMHYAAGGRPGHISADYFGFFAERLKDLLGVGWQHPPFVGIMANGPCGDAGSFSYAPDRPPEKPRAPYEKMRIIANDLAEEVLRVRRTLRHRDGVSLQAATDELELRMRRPNPELLEWANQVLARPAGVPPKHPHEATYARRTLAAAEWPETTSVMLQAFRVGDLCITAIPFEVFVDIGLEIKTRSPFKDTFTIELANGSSGYLPTPERHRLGGYETWLGTSRVELEASVKITDKLLEMMKGLR